MGADESEGDDPSVPDVDCDFEVDSDESDEGDLDDVDDDDDDEDDHFEDVIVDETDTAVVSHYEDG